MKRFVVGLLLFGCATVMGQAAVTLNRAAVLTWDAVAKDVNGVADVVVAYDVAITLTGVDLNAAGTQYLSLVEVGKLDTSGTLLFATLKNGNYQAQARAVDAAGNVSAWGVPFVFAFDGDAPAVPLNLRKK